MLSENAPYFVRKSYESLDNFDAEVGGVATLVTSGNHYGVQGIPIFSTSTVGFKSIEDLEGAGHGENIYGVDAQVDAFTDFGYGADANPVDQHLRRVLAVMHRGTHVFNTVMGVTALDLCVRTFTQQGSSVMIPDSVYFPVRRTLEESWAKHGVSTITYADDSDAKEKIHEGVGLMFIESPGSVVFDVQDCLKLTDIARNYGTITAFDNTWATPSFFRPLDFGADVAVEALTKYLGGHGNCYGGALITRDLNIADRIHKEARYSGTVMAPQQASQILEGMKSFIPRMKTHIENTAEIMPLLQQSSVVEEILYPGIEENSQNDLWDRQYGGSTSLVSISMPKGVDKNGILKSIDGLCRKKGSSFTVGNPGGGLFAEPPKNSTFIVGESWGGPQNIINMYDRGDTIVRLAIGYTSEKRTREDVAFLMEQLEINT